MPRSYSDSDRSVVQSHIVDYAQIEALAAVLSESSSVTEMEIRQGNERLRLRRPPPPPKPRTKPKQVSPTGSSTTGSAVSTATADTVLSSIETVTAGYVGIFHVARKAPVSVGDIVEKDRVLGHIETMRLLNDCIAVVSGRLQAILVMDGQPVEYGQPLFEIEPMEPEESK